MTHILKALAFTIVYVPTRLLEAAALRLARSMQNSAERRSDRGRR